MCVTCVLYGGSFDTHLTVNRVHVGSINLHQMHDKHIDRWQTLQRNNRGMEGAIQFLTRAGVSLQLGRGAISYPCLQAGFYFSNFTNWTSHLIQKRNVRMCIRASPSIFFTWFRSLYYPSTSTIWTIVSHTVVCWIIKFLVWIESAKSGISVQ